MHQVVQTLVGFDYDIIYIHLNLIVDNVMKYDRHRIHIGSTRIFQTKWHHPIMIYTPSPNKSYLLHLPQPPAFDDNMHNNPPTNKFHAQHNYDHNVNVRKWKIIFWAGFVEILVTETYSDLPIFFGYRKNILQPSQVLCHFH